MALIGFCEGGFLIPCFLIFPPTPCGVLKMHLFKDKILHKIQLVDAVCKANHIKNIKKTEDSYCNLVRAESLECYSLLDCSSL